MVELADGNEFTGVMWVKDTTLNPHHYMVRLFESRERADRWAKRQPANIRCAIFHMICVDQLPVPVPEVELDQVDPDQPEPGESSAPE